MTEKPATDPGYVMKSPAFEKQKLSAYAIAQRLSHVREARTIDSGAWCIIVRQLSDAFTAEYGKQFDSVEFERGCVYGPGYGS